MTQDGLFMGLLSHLAVSLHEAAGASVIGISTLEAVPQEAMESLVVAKAIEVPGKVLRPKKDVRRVLWETAAEVKERVGAVLFTVYDPEKDTSVVGVAVPP